MSKSPLVLRDRTADLTSSRRAEDVAGEDVDELCERWDNGLSMKNLAIAKRYSDAKTEFSLVITNQGCRPAVATP